MADQVDRAVVPREGDFTQCPEGLEACSHLLKVFAIMFREDDSKANEKKDSKAPREMRRVG